jgi:predicted alpha-1,2-mannosidase
MPFAMTAWTPETRATEQKCIAPYYFKDREISGFRGSHWLSGSCVQDYGSVTLMPVTGAIKVAPEDRASFFRHQTETMNPAYYSVLLDRYHERVEMTGAVRSGMLRIHVPSGAVPSILVEPNARSGEGFVEIYPERREIVGYNPVHRLYQGSGQTAGFSGYFVARFQQPFQKYGTWCGKEIHEGTDQQRNGCKQLGAYATFAATRRPLLVKIGTSFTSLDEAARNLGAEEPGWDFNSVQQKTEAAWKERLNRIEIEGATPEQRHIFYSAFYHASLAPRITSDADGTYNGFAQQGRLQRVSSGSYYDDFSLWDTFRAVHPLLTIIDPGREQEMVQSLVLKGEQGGFLPIFPLWNSYTSEMVGDHADAVIADAYAKGLTGFDVVRAYSLMLQNATVTPPRDRYVLGYGRRALQSYLRFGYIPLEDKVVDAFHPGEQVSRTLEYAYDDSLVAMMAERLGKPGDAAMLEKRAQNWRNVIDPNSGFARGRHEDGSWILPFNPALPASYITEGLPWQYTFFVPQNVPGLIGAVGGRDKFIAKLDGLFARGLYDQGNEPSHQIAYLYDYAGVPAKTEQHVRAIVTTEYHDGPDGLPGNDDAGQMSAWYMFSAMGFYPVSPGTPSYAIGTPLFSRVTIHLSNGKDFVIVATHQGPRNFYIQAQWLNGVRIPGFQLSQADITKGGTLRFDMGPKPKLQ